jgi:membrane protein YdbS with pleckstrin-like domain
VPISARLLNDDEEVLVDLRPHWLFFVGPAFWTLLALVTAIALALAFPKAPHFVGWLLTAMVAIPAVWLAGRTIRWFGYSLVVTTHRIVLKQGVMRRNLVQLRLQRVTEVHFTQSLVKRLLGTGRLVIDVQGESDAVTVEDVRSPRSLQRVINNQLNALNETPAGLDHDVAPGAGMLTDFRAAPALDDFDQDRTPPHGQPPTLVGSGPPPVPPVAPRPAERGFPGQPTLHQQLIDLDDLRQRGILSPAEFEAKKSELLSRL